MAFVSDTDARIIALRRNGGGDPDVVAAFASFFRRVGAPQRPAFEPGGSFASFFRRVGARERPAFEPGGSAATDPELRRSLQKRLQDLAKKP